MVPHGVMVGWILRERNGYDFCVVDLCNGYALADIA